ncbi:hypothetical protein E8E14_014069 [Neopestalotiopsis sp. 37M]|nr:hypothetical protein E8E14_014069 [Neopestalotiopsis sp. 37M]
MHFAQLLQTLAVFAAAATAAPVEQPVEVKARSSCLGGDYFSCTNLLRLSCSVTCASRDALGRSQCTNDCITASQTDCADYCSSS